MFCLETNCIASSVPSSSQYNITRTKPTSRGKSLHFHLFEKSYEVMQNILHLVEYEKHQWRVCCDLKVVALLCDMQTGYTKNMCFLCFWETRYKGNILIFFLLKKTCIYICIKGDQYIKHDWMPCNEFQLNQGNVILSPLVSAENILLPPLHIKLGMVKFFFKVVVKRPEVFACLQQVFRKLSPAKLNEGN